MTEFKTDFSKKDGYSVTFSTNDVEKYKFVQNACRQALDGVTERTCRNVSTKPDQFYCSNCGFHADIKLFDLPVDLWSGVPKYCPKCKFEVIK